jgi:hypothetical protein
MSGLRSNTELMKGSRLMVFVEGTTAGVYEPIGFATSHTLSMTKNTSQVSTKDHGDYPATIGQNITWEVTAENLYSDAGEGKYMELMNSMNTVTLEFAEASEYNNYGSDELEKGIVQPEGDNENWTPGSVIARGQALVTSFSINAPAGDNATMSVTFTGTGALKTSSF